MGCGGSKSVESSPVVAKSEISTTAPRGTLHLDLLSQPCRALAIVNRLAKLGLEEKNLSLLKGEHKSAEFLKINPAGAVPGYSEGDFNLAESIAIVLYLINSRDVPDHWYPKEAKARARVDEFLSWQHTGIRKAGIGSFLPVTFEKMQSGNIDRETLTENVKALEKALGDIETRFLKGKDFIVGSKPSIADLWGVCEVMQPVSAGYDLKDRFPAVAAWVERVKAATQPHFDDTHKVIMEFGSQHTFDYNTVIEK